MSTRSDSCDFLAARVLREFFGNTVKHRRVALLPSAPATPGGREHADEVSMTPATQRRHSVTVLQSPREKEKSGGDSADPEKSGLARRLENSLSDPALLQLRVQTNASSSSKESNARSPSDSGSDSSSGSDSPRWPHLGPASPENERAEMGLRCPVMHRTVRVEDEDRGPFWGRWEPLPAAELAAAAAAEALANRHFPRLSDASTDPSDERDDAATSPPSGTPPSRTSALPRATKKRTKTKTRTSARSPPPSPPPRSSPPSTRPRARRRRGARGD
jgi:syndecan 1